MIKPQSTALLTAFARAATLFAQHAGQDLLNQCVTFSEAVQAAPERMMAGKEALMESFAGLGFAVTLATPPRLAKAFYDFGETLSSAVEKVGKLEFAPARVLSMQTRKPLTLEI